MDISVLGIDLGKNSCSVVGLDATGKVIVRRRMRRETVITYASALPSCVVAMEACCGAHHMGRALVRQVPNDNHDERSCCLTRGCSQAATSLPHHNAPSPIRPVWSIRVDGVLRSAAVGGAERHPINP